jgi:alkanesulfonate monooxygenase SsuD/methylene tetrahydromethanopterin reductase-like flavin-dependent oxidoreductase (luciferase family)
MRLGIYLDMRNPPRWPTAWPDLYRATIDLVVEAERHGADAVWLTEHHGFEDGYLSQPLAMAAALAATTRSVRIGTAVVLAPLRHPLHIAEEAALVDVLSAGRLELGLGAGYVRPEFEAFGVGEAQRYLATEACVRRLQELFAGGELKPPPVQAPVPIWLGYQGPQGARRAGALGVGLLSLDRDLYGHYLQGRAEAGAAGPGRVGGVVNLLLARDPERAREQVLPHLAYHLNSYRQASGRGGRPPRVLQVDELRREFQATGAARGFKVLDARQACAEVAALTSGLPAEHLLFWCRIGGMPESLVAEHLELLFGEVKAGLASGQPLAGEPAIALLPSHSVAGE